MRAKDYRHLGQVLFVHLSMLPDTTYEWRRSFILSICDVLLIDNPRFDKERFMADSRLDEVLENVSYEPNQTQPFIPQNDNNNNKNGHHNN